MVTKEGKIILCLLQSKQRALLPFDVNKCNIFILSKLVRDLNMTLIENFLNKVVLWNLTVSQGPGAAKIAKKR